MGNLQDVAVIAAVLSVMLASVYIIYEGIRSRKTASQRVAHSNGRSVPSTLVGRKAFVTTEIDHLGVVVLDDETWTACSGDGSIIPVGTWVHVRHTNGLTLMVWIAETQTTPHNGGSI